MRASVHFSSLMVLVALTFVLAVKKAHTESGVAESPRQEVPADVVANVNAALGLTASHIVQPDIQTTPSAAYRVNLPVEDGTYTIDLYPHSVRSKNYQVLVDNGTGELTPVEPSPVNTYRGQIIGMEGSRVTVGISDYGMEGTIELPDGREMYFEPVRFRVSGTTARDYVVYRHEDVIPTGGSCGTPFSNVQGGRATTYPEVSGTACGGEYCVAELACDADVEYFEDYGSVAAVEGRINLITNNNNIQYERDVEISHEITTIIVRTMEPDPYSSTDSFGLVSQFRSYWNANHSGVQRDVAELFTGKEINGDVIGRAWTIGAVCNVSNAYCFVQSDCCGAFSCAKDLSAHELGHLWNAVHCSCGGWTMNPVITCANKFHPSFTVPDIVVWRNAVSCLESSSCSSPSECDDGNPCTDDDCVDSACTHTNNTDPCNDGNSCTENDTCGGSSCTGTPIDCNDGDPCTTDSCSGGMCSNIPFNCNDGNGCTDDTCVGGACQHTDNTDPCDDSDPCTENDTCGGGSCEGTAVDCDDADPCTIDSCNGGLCDNEPIICNDGNSCTTDSCVGGSCSFVNNTNACNDGDACTENDTCGGGSCNGTPANCDDGDPCTVDSCGPSGCVNEPILCTDVNPCTNDACVGGECVFTPNNNACSDFDACTTADACIEGQCIGTPVDCDDGDPCTVDTCGPIGCEHTPTNDACDDGDPCTSNDSCSSGTCVGDPIDCDDGNPCTDDTCGTGGCSNVPNNDPCDDGDGCTVDDMCSASACAGTPLDCDDNNPCTDDSCDPEASVCVNADNSDPCDDGDPCTLGDQCSGGSCSGTLHVFGDVNSDSQVDIFDIFCVLDGFVDVFDNCTAVSVDIAGNGDPCSGDGNVDVFDIFAVLDAFSESTNCCK